MQRTPPSPTDYHPTLTTLIDSIIAPSAVDIDRTGTFPRGNIDALGHVGLLSVLSAPEVGGSGLGLRAAADVIEHLAAACGSTAMVALMHYAAVPVIEAHGPRPVREAIAAGKHLSTLAFSEAGSRSHFWAPMGTARRVDGHIRLDASKSWVTSAGEANSYVWSSRPLAGQGLMTLWLVPSHARGLSQNGAFDGLGLRGNGSTPVAADGLEVAEAAMLGRDGGGLDIALTLVLPTFLVLSAAFSIGLMEAVASEAATHLTATRLEHLDRSLAQQQGVRLDFARLRLELDRTRALLDDTLSALEDSRADAMLRVLEVKAAASEAALQVTDLAMKLCGGAAFRKELGIERRFSDARAARVMAPTTDALLDFVGRASLGLPLLDEAVAR
ncbi:MAG TPA: acyl-CoA dehydrogenase family protein [Chloroflexota bacterium]